MQHVLCTDHQVKLEYLICFYPAGATVKSQTAIYYHVDVVTVYYHWRVGEYCRKELDNFRVEAASVETEKERKKERKKEQKED